MSHITASLDFSNEFVTVRIERPRDSGTEGPAPRVVLEMEWAEACRLRDAIDDAIKTPPRHRAGGA